MNESTLSYSVIVPHYNAGDLLRRALSSIPKRSDIEVIVVDDKSTEQTIHDIQKAPEFAHIQFIFPEDKATTGGARNIGLRAARGEYILFLDSDDLFCSRAFETFDKTRDQNLDLVQFKVTSFVEGTDLLGSRHLYLEELYEQEGLERYLSNTQPVAKMIRRRFLKDNDIVFTEATGGEDIYFCTQVALLAATKHFIPEVVYNISQNQSSVTAVTRPALERNRIQEQIRRLELIRRLTPINFWWPYLAKRNVLPTISRYLKDQDTPNDLKAVSLEYKRRFPKTIYYLYKILSAIKGSN